MYFPPRGGLKLGKQGEAAEWRDGGREGGREGGRGGGREALQEGRGRLQLNSVHCSSARGREVTESSIPPERSSVYTTAAVWREEGEESEEREAGGER